MSNHGRDHHHGHDMTNSHLLTQAFDYCRPATVDEAIEFLAQQGERAAVLAGGTFLLVQMKMEQMLPQCLVDISRLPGLTGISDSGDSLGIGSGVTIWDLRNAPVVRAHYTALAEACAAFGSTQIQLTGTIGGNVCNGSPASDTVPALAALGADMVLTGPGGERTIPIEKFLLGPGKTAIARGELLTAIRIQKPSYQAGSAFVKLSRVRADLAKASVAAVIVRDGDRVVDCRLALGAVGPTVIRAPSAEKMLLGEPFSTDLALAAGQAASQEASPIDDVRSTARYRRRAVSAVCYDALLTAWQRAGESRSAAPVEGASRQPGGRGNPGFPEHADQAPSLRHLGAQDTRVVTLRVNGVERHLRVRSNELLINVLRDRLNLTGTKYGCGIGECGACTVHVDGVPTLSCLTLAVAVDGREITTVEGLARPGGELDPLQEAFIEEAALQCGYCTPGMLMMTKRLLADNPAAGEVEIRDYLKGNRCRCTGFAAIVRAVMSCAE